MHSLLRSLRKKLLMKEGGRDLKSAEYLWPPSELRSAEDPLFYHCPFGSPWNGMPPQIFVEFRHYANELLRKAKKCQQCKLEEVVRGTYFLTYNTRKEKSLIEKCYGKYDIPVIVLGSASTRWNWLCKIQLVLEYLQSQSTLREHILVTDASDVILTKCPHSIIDRFCEYNAGVVFCNTAADWPPCKELYIFELQRYIENPFHAHLSAGGYFGKTEKVVKYLSEIYDAYVQQEPWAFYRGKFDDQLAWRYLHRKYYPDIQIDHRSRIFKRYDVFKDLVY